MFERSFIASAALAAIGIIGIGLTSCASSNSKSTARQPSGAQSSLIEIASPSTQQRFASPQAAVDALREACRTNNRAALMGMFGQEFPELVDSGDAALDSAARERFARLADEKTHIQPLNERTMELVVGTIGWPFPIPMVRESDGWRWDTATGADEIISRRIGRNELAAIEVCQAYVAAQAEYSRLDRDGDRVLEYAQHVVSTPGSHDGLYWERTNEGDLPSPLDLLAAIAEELFPDHKEGDPLMGYRFRILAKQGGNVPGGKYDYVINDNMIAGFALVAWPAEYGNSGIMTFVINHQGRVLQTDLGEKSESIASKMKTYNPDDAWVEVQ